MEPKNPERDDEFIIEEDGETETDTTRKLREKLKKAVAEKQEYLEGWQRMRADFTNEKRTNDARLASLVADVRVDAAQKIIPIVDAFDMAMKGAGWNDVDAAWRTGVERLRDEALKALKELGVEVFDPTGEEFNPHSMSASREVETADQDNRVIAVDQYGYRAGEVIVRPAFVAVGKKASNP